MAPLAGTICWQLSPAKDGHPTTSVMPSEPLISYLYRALHSEHGVEVTSNDPENLRHRLYAARREAKDPELDNLQLSPSPFDPAKLWIVKRSKPDETP